jgi:hypothetical protein
MTRRCKRVAGQLSPKNKSEAFVLCPQNICRVFGNAPRSGLAAARHFSHRAIAIAERSDGQVGSSLHCHMDSSLMFARASG